MTILPTQNKEWGFWGTAKGYINSKRKMLRLWEEISTLLQENANLTPEQTRELLDSRWGRHIVDRYCEELRTNIRTFIEMLTRVITQDRIVEDYRYYVDENAFENIKPNIYKEFSKELTQLCKKYKVTLQVTGGVRICTDDEIKLLNGYTSDLKSGDLEPVWKEN